MLSLRCFSPPGVRSSLFLKVDQCFYALVVGSVVPRGESTAFLCLGVMNDKVVKEHYGTRALSTCPPPSKEAVNLEGSVVTMGARWFKGYAAHIQPQLIVGFSWANFDLPRVLASQVGLQQNCAELFTRPFSVGWYLFGCDGVDRARMETHFMLTKGRSGWNRRHLPWEPLTLEPVRRPPAAVFLACLLFIFGREQTFTCS